MLCGISKTKYILAAVTFIISIFIVIVERDTYGMWLRSLFLIPLSLSTSFMLTPFAHYFALKFGIVDYPAQRKMHREATPLLGGAPVYLGFAFATVSIFWYSVELKGIVYGATLIFIVGLLDDMKGLSSIIRLFSQLIAVGILIYHGILIDAIPDFTHALLIKKLVTILWVIGITNAVNFLDGLDGLCSGYGAIAAFFFGIIALLTKQYFLMFLAFALCGSCLGFLPWNFIKGKSAKIFLGDAGSLFIGFTLSSLAIIGDWAENKVVALSVPILIMFIPIFDTMLTTFMRIKNGQVKSVRQWLDFVGKDHFHHRIFALGIGKQKAVWVLYLLAILLGFSAIIIRTGGTFEAYLALIQAFFILIFFTAFIINLNVMNQDKIENDTLDKPEKSDN